MPGPQTAPSHFSTPTRPIPTKLPRSPLFSSFPIPLFHFNFFHPLLPISPRQPRPRPIFMHVPDSFHFFSHPHTSNNLTLPPCSPRVSMHLLITHPRPIKFSQYLSYTNPFSNLFRISIICLRNLMFTVAISQQLLSLLTSCITFCCMIPLHIHAKY
ncbi:uncharacterized protein EI90DRAFT_3065815 [Cantharellus anzutake]|uniref:uncharacterized protein n=1 Tax=Cantharellus anzutake TaxID=1750568 RepID=UPI001903ACD9|nr:uncharacterized protein EI90DRAFT_3065815 [Cantharellus anzutake]KAF8328181.1 hypothetical protein EI90DRAFT_3065815 [Cantharellus anzutake]